MPFVGGDGPTGLGVVELALIVAHIGGTGNSPRSNRSTSVCSLCVLIIVVKEKYL